jgi:signal transduction histidine kinase
MNIGQKFSRFSQFGGVFEIESNEKGTFVSATLRIEKA